MTTNDAINGLQDEVSGTWEQAVAAMQEGRFEQAADFYRHIIALLFFLKDRYEETPTAIKVNLANACADLAACLLETCGTNVNEAVHALLESINQGNREPKVMQNLLYCMGAVNAYLRASGTKAPECANKHELCRLHNLGYDLLKTPYPQGTPDRNWEEAIRCLEEAVQLAPDCAPSYHLLGLAYEGAKQDAKALEAWWKVRQLDYDFDFQTRLRI